MVKEIEVDIWKTDMHKVEVGIKKQEEHRAKSRQFTADSDVIGEYNYKGTDQKGYITIRKDPWEAELTNRKLVIKSFTESMNWKGSLEEMVAVGLSRTLAVGGGMPTFTVNLSNYDKLVRLERLFKPRSFNKPMFNFMFVDNNELQSYRIEADRFSIGSDWKVYDKYDHEVAEVDGAALNLGGKWVIKIKDDEYDFHPSFDEVLVLFAGMVKYVEEVEKKLEEVADKLDEKDQETDLYIDNDEIDLYDNPRRLKY